VSIFRKFAKADRVYDSQPYRETMRSVEKVASSALKILNDKSAEEKAKILERVTELSEKLQDAIDHEIPLVVSLTLLSAIRVHEQAIQHYGDTLAADR
jgi:hypothetical protein